MSHHQQTFSASIRSMSFLFPLSSFSLFPALSLLVFIFLSVYSTRTFNSECVNEEGLQSLHLADGVFNIYQTGTLSPLYSSSPLLLFSHLPFSFLFFPLLSSSFLFFPLLSVLISSCRTRVCWHIPRLGLGEDSRYHLCTGRGANFLCHSMPLSLPLPLSPSLSLSLSLPLPLSLFNFFVLFNYNFNFNFNFLAESVGKDEFCWRSDGRQSRSGRA